MSQVDSHDIKVYSMLFRSQLWQPLELKQPAGVAQEIGGFQSRLPHRGVVTGGKGRGVVEESKSRVEGCGRWHLRERCHDRWFYLKFVGGFCHCQGGNPGKHFTSPGFPCCGSRSGLCQGWLLGLRKSWHLPTPPVQQGGTLVIDICDLQFDNWLLPNR